MAYLVTFWPYYLHFKETESKEYCLKGPVLTDVDVWVPHDSMLDTLLFLIYIYIYIYINVLVGDLLIDKQFEADTPLFSVVYNVDTSAYEGTNDVGKLNKWAYQWKMVFNCNPLKYTQKVTFTKKISKEDHASLFFKKNGILFLMWNKIMLIILWQFFFWTWMDCLRKTLHLKK